MLRLNVRINNYFKYRDMTSAVYNNNKGKCD